MNKKMREIKAKIEKMNEEAVDLLNEHKVDEAEAKIAEIEQLEREYVVAEKLEENSKANVTEEVIDKAIAKKQSDGFKFLAKVILGKNLNEVENALIVPGSSETDTNGMNYLIPEDVEVAIRELRRSYNSAKDLVNVIPVNTLTGSTNFETEDDGLLDDFTDGEEVAEGDYPKFIRKSWKIAFKGNIIYISNILLGNEKASLLSYINKWFVRKAIRTENKDIFETLVEGKTAKQVTGLNALKKVINKMDPSCLIDSVIVTNQTGFAAMDEETDSTGRGMLQVDPTNASRKLFQNIPIRVFLDKELKNVEGKAPMLIGNLKNGEDFMDRNRLEFATSEHFAFNKNQLAMRLMEGYDTVQTDSDSYEYIEYTSPTVSV